MIGTTQFTHERLAEDAPIFQKVRYKESIVTNFKDRDYIKPGAIYN